MSTGTDSERGVARGRPGRGKRTQETAQGNLTLLMPNFIDRPGIFSLPIGALLISIPKSLNQNYSCYCLNGNWKD